MQRLMILIGLQAYALALAALQFFNGVRTDEAKYLLNIPYPHPPLGRSILSLLDGWSGQEIFWRIVLASLVVHAVWLVIDLVKGCNRKTVVAIAVAWLLCASVVYQAGTVMMAPLTALQALVFVWLLLRDRAPDGNAVGLMGLFWLASLFTAYQAALFFPLVWAVLMRANVSFNRKALLWGIPVVLLCLYTLTNPLVAASMISHAGKDVAQTLSHRFAETLLIIGLGGSMVLCFTGTVGMVRERSWGLIGSLFLVTAYVVLSRYYYYAILFTPLFVAGTALFLRRYQMVAVHVLLAVPLCTALLWSMHSPIINRDHASAVMNAIEDRGLDGPILISGYFGHQWQYRSRSPVLRYNPSLLGDAQAVICTGPCEIGIADDGRFTVLDGLPMTVWVKNE